MEVGLLTHTMKKKPFSMVRLHGPWCKRALRYPEPCLRHFGGTISLTSFYDQKMTFIVHVSQQVLSHDRSRGEPTLTCLLTYGGTSTMGKRNGGWLLVAILGKI